MAVNHTNTHGIEADSPIKDAQMMLGLSQWAATKLAQMDRDQINRIVQAMASVASEKAQYFAEQAVTETGMGVVEHKKIKNEACSIGLVKAYENEDFITPRIDSNKKIVEIPRPAGVIFALTPITNPVATVFFKSILAMLTRNAILLSPHPGAKKCCVEAANLLAAAAEAAGAPKGAIQVVPHPTVDMIQTLMGDSRVDLILATGGPAVVKAAYRSGNPAIGVGSGNAPVLVDGTAALDLTAARIVASKSFDHSILCTNESNILALDSIADDLLRALKHNGAHICNPDETEKLRALLFTDAGFNVAAIGKSAEDIARHAGFNAKGAKILVALIEKVTPTERLMREKMCPVIGFTRVASIDAALSVARLMMRDAGRGHSAAIHSNNEATIMRFAAAVPALRIVVNAGCSQGASGLHTNLDVSMTIGTGFVGGSSVGDNLGPRHLLNFVRIAYNKDAKVAMGNFAGLSATSSPQVKPAVGGIRGEASSITTERDALAGVPSNLQNDLRRLIAEEIRAALVQ